MPDLAPNSRAKRAVPVVRAEQQAQYDAFISYSHAADGSLAPALQHGLQTLAKPLYQRKALRVFRDQTNLAATPGLWPEIEAALSASRYLILLASPAAARSRWVQQELDWWYRHRDLDHLLIGVTHGRVAWDPYAGDFDWNATSALPWSMSRWFSDEPLWVNLQWAENKSALSHRDPRLQEDLATLAAPIRGMSRDNLIGRDLKLHRRIVRLTVMTITVLVALALAAGTGAWLAVQQRDTARQQTALAETRALDSAAKSEAPTQLDLALLLAQRSVRMDPTPDAYASLFTAVSASPRLARFMTQRATVTALTGGPGDDVIVGDAQGDVSVLDTAQARQQVLPGGNAGSVTALADSGPGGTVAAGYANGTVRLWSLSTGSLRWHQALGQAVKAIAVSPGTATIAALLSNYQVVVLNAASGKTLDRFSFEYASQSEGLGHVGFLSDDTVLAADDAGDTEVWRTAPQPHVLSTHGQLAPGDEPAASAWSGNGQAYVFAVGSTAYVSQTTTGQSLGTFTSLPATADTLALDENGNRLAYISDGQPGVLDRSATAAKAGRTSTQLPGFTNTGQIAFTADGQWLVAGGGTTLALYDLQQTSRLATELPTEVAPVVCSACTTSVAADPHGRLVAWTDGRNIDCHDLRNGQRRTYADDDVFADDQLAFTPDGSALLSYGTNPASGTGEVGVWPTSAGCPAATSVHWIQTGNYSPGQLLPVDQNHVVLTSGGFGQVGLLDLRQGKIVRTYRVPGGGDQLGAAAVSADGRSLAVSLASNKIAWFSVSSGAETGQVSSGSAGDVAFVPGSQDVAQTTSNAVLLWDPRRGQIGAFDDSGSVWHLAFSSDGKLLFTLDDQDSLSIWATAQQTLIGSLQALPLVDSSGNPLAGGKEYGNRTSMGLDDNDNLWVAAASAYPTRWSLSPAGWSKLACTMAGRTLSPAEWRHYVGTSPPADLSCVP